MRAKPKPFFACIACCVSIALAGCGGGSGSPSTNPVPSITSLSPASATNCGKALTLSVNGSNFIPASIVNWNGVRRTTSYVSATEVTALIAPQDIAATGTSIITVVNPGPGGGSSSGMGFEINCAAQVSIDMQSLALGTINKNVFGANFTGAMDLTNQNPTYGTMITMLQNAKFGMARWPFALLSDYYHWQSNSFSSCAAPYGLVSRMTFDQFMQQVAQPLGLDVNITVNYGSNSTCTAGGDPNEAAAWVDYANNQKKYGIKYWTIGNEQYYGSPTLGASPTTPDFNISPSATDAEGSSTYANLVATQFYPLMKAKDPSIQVGIDLVVPDSSVSGRTIPWDSTVLANAKFDFVEVHWYGSSPPNTAISDSALLNSDSYFTSAISQLQSELSAVGKANTPIYVGEWGVPGPDGGSSQNITIVGALYTALVLGELTKANVGMAGIWEGFDSGPCATSPQGNYSWQSWYTSSLFEAIPGGTNPACPSVVQPSFGTVFPRANALEVVEQAFRPGDAVITPATSSTPKTVRAFATRRDAGYGLLLINLDQDRDISINLGLLNDTRHLAATSVVYGKAQYDDSRNNVWTPPISQALGTVTESFSIVLPRWSVTAVTLSEATSGTVLQK